MRDSFKIISGLIAISIYLVLITLVFGITNSKDKERAVHYVKKNTQEAITVSLAGSKQKVPKKEGKKKNSSKKPKQKPKKIRNITTPKPPISKVQPSKKPAKKIQTKDLFSSVKSQSKPEKKTQTKASKFNQNIASKKVPDSIKKPTQNDRGVENAYLASIEEKLQGWPEQANFAGEQISVLLTIYPSGRFDFKVKHLSANSEFNEALIAYLKQLQSIGLGKHKRTKPYKILVEFEATE
ncbi:MAG: TonB C-terminal domain-containing protein [Sulfurovum sp.]|nr:TonB C-terminal domain-containing protein [Sulfurovum sp.]